MGDNTNDRRRQKTEKAIRNALVQLMENKELRKITVQEVSDLADINRATFYKHYLDVYDLYEKVEQEILVEIGILVLRLQELPPNKFFKELTAYFDKNRTVSRLLFSPNGENSLRIKFDRCMEGLFRQMGAEKLGVDRDNLSLCYYSCYRSQGCIAVLEKWVNGGFTVPKELIMKTLSELDANTECFAPSKMKEEYR